MTDQKNNPVRRIWQMGGGTHVVVLAPPIVKALSLNEETYLEEVITPEGILLKLKRLT